MKTPQPLLTREIRLFHPFMSALAICLLSGAAIYFSSGTAWWSQFNVLGHILVGIYFTILCLPYLLRHFRRTLGIRRPAVLLSGLLAALLLLGFVYTGLHLSIVGHTESTRLVVELHLYGGIAMAGLFLLHLLLHKIIPARKDGDRFHTLATYPARRAFVSIGLYAGTIGLATLAYAAYYSPPEIEAAAREYRYDYGEHPFRPSQSETPGSRFIPTAQVAGSSDCASCHADIAAQWSSSVHKQAASDPTYVTNINLLEENMGISATRYCEGCHAPVALLSGQLTPGGKHGGVAGTPAHIEGISCVSCHRITHAVHLEGVASYHFAPAGEYLFQYAQNGLLKRINHYLINVSASGHRVDMTQDILSQPTLCATCHTQFMDKDMNDWGWIKMQDDYSAWLNSPYSRQHEQNFASESVVQCRDCHMPLVAATDPSADADGKVRSHRFAAANTMLAYLNQDTEQLDATIAFLRSNRMNITIEPPHRESATQSKLNLDESLRDHRETPFYHYLGETMNLNVIVSNTGVGHDFPAGTIDINEAWVELIVRDAEGRTVYHSGAIDADDVLDPGSHRYLSIPVNRQGKAVWRHDLFNMTGETYRNVVQAGESDVVDYAFDIPYWAKGPLVIDATLKYRKLNTRYAKWALKEKYRPLPIVDMTRDSQIVEIRHEPRVIGD